MSSSSKTKIRLMVAGGGTGGHLFPGLAVADVWAKSPDRDAVFLGSPTGMEADVVPKYGYPFFPLESRRLKNSSLKQRITSLLRMPFIILRAWRIMRQTRPDCVLGVGGYVSGPAVLAASLSGIPTAVAEQNARPGLTNRILGRWVRRVYTAFPEAESYFPVRKVRMLGNPVRSAFEPSEMTEMTDLKQTRRILILGGSQGARFINETMPHVLAAVAKRYDAFEVLHQSGKGRDSLVRAAYDTCGLSQVRVSAFIDDMAQEVSNAHLVIGRSGATTVAELAAVGRPAYFIPFPFAADDHQAANASSLVDCGAARMIREAQIDVETWAEELAVLLADASRLKAMGDQARSRGVPESADEIVKDLLSLTFKGKGGLS